VIQDVAKTSIAAETQVLSEEQGTSYPPRVFISYSWDSLEHKNWVLELAIRLRSEGGVKVTLDYWCLWPGADRERIIEENIRESDFVILVCTPAYAERANKREGGVGYEAVIITGELYESSHRNKFIPVLRAGSWTGSLPTRMKSIIGVDLRNDPIPEEAYTELLRALHNSPPKPPEVGPKPIFSDQIAYAWYESDGETVQRVQAYVSPSTQGPDLYVFRSSLTVPMHWTKDRVAKRYRAFDRELRSKGFIRTRNFNDDPMFGLPE
jgi:hypothetical protein